MKLISLNIEGDRHFTARVLPFLLRENADVICLQEVMADQVSVLEEKLRMVGKFSPSVDIDPTVPFEVGNPGGVGILGNLVLVRRGEETSAAGARFGYQYYAGSVDQIPVFTRPERMARALTWIELQFPDAHRRPVSYTIATTHFTWSPMGSFTPQQQQEFAELIKVLDRFDSLILCGDFNSPRQSGVDNVFARLARRYHDWIPPQVNSTLDYNLHKAGPLNLVVDGLFTTPDYVCRDVRVVDGVSDHRAVVAEVEKVGPQI